VIDAQPTMAVGTASLFKSDIRRGFKILTHDWRPPAQGVDPVVRHAADLAITLPSTELDTSSTEYGAGSHYCATLSQAARTSGFWPNGRPARCVSVLAGEDAIDRGASRRASVLTITALCTDEEIRTAMGENCEANHLTVGIRDAYHHGLAIAVATGPSEVGYTMDR
jgi:hypothetical protein